MDRSWESIRVPRSHLRIRRISSPKRAVDVDLRIRCPVLGRLVRDRTVRILRIVGAAIRKGRKLIAEARRAHDTTGWAHDQLNRHLAPGTPIAARDNPASGDSARTARYDA